MIVQQTNTFRKAVKKLHINEKSTLDRVVRKIIKQPDIGQQKKGDLRSVCVYKYKQREKQILLAYSVNDDVLTLLALGSHENFYRKLSKQIK